MTTEAERLLTWFDRHRRDLPWRRDRDPYRVWLSEIMLQQTRVETVIPFYEAFISRFPSVAHLAAAPIDAVLAAWSGLGYYRRARQLHAAAQQVAAEGSFPRDVEGLLKLPGIGPYTAAAIASICFGVAVPVLDGNVERVLARRLAEGGDVKSGSVRRGLLEAATRLLDPSRAGDSNQAMMELGATVCIPKNPRCLLCPLTEGCLALAMGEADLYPKARTDRKSEEKSIVAVVVEDEERRTLLFRRPDDSSLLAGLWEVPWVEAAVEEADAELGRRYGGSWRLLERIGTARHGITYRDLRVAIHLGEVGSRGVIREGAEAGWFAAEDIRRLATSSLVGKILAARQRASG
ncbi:MAG: A/G-specific adenine glycosylase [Acidobacteriota bacterium]